MKPLFLRPFVALVPVVLAALAMLLAMAWHGALKPPGDWSGLDIVGEGGTAILVFCWLFWVLRSRPGGRVTQLLGCGLALVFLAMWADTLDEFIRLPATISWDHWLESASMLPGLLLLTLGIYHWHQEQLAINRQMHQRERLFREHRHFDALTPLAGAAYLRRQLEQEYARRKYASGAPVDFTLIALDLRRFTAVNREHGYREGDRALQLVSQLLLLNLREGDLLCRLAGDRFVALLPATDSGAARQLAEELCIAVASLAYRTRQQQRLQLRARASVVGPQPGESVDALLLRLGQPESESEPAVVPAFASA